MKLRRIALLATLAVVAAWPDLVSAEAASQDRQTTTPAFRETIPNIPAKSLVGLVVHYPPGGGTRAHYHPRSAFVTGYVLSGSIRSRVNDGKAQVFRAGETGRSRRTRITPSARRERHRTCKSARDLCRRHHRCRATGYVQAAMKMPLARPVRLSQQPAGEGACERGDCERR